MHAQIVLCPGTNDGDLLKRTITDLYGLYPYLGSVSVVPVGLTAHRKTKLRPIEKEDAEKALQTIEAFQKRFRKKHGDPIVYGADELYIKAGRPLPPASEYGDFPQLENGVGGVSLFASSAKKMKLRTDEAVEASFGEKAHIRIGPKQLERRYVTFTGISFYPYLERFAEKLRKAGINLAIVPVENHFFGKSVTVTGLLTGRDVIRTLSEDSGTRDLLLIPDIVLRHEADIFLDDLHFRDIGEALKIKAVVIKPTPEGILRGIAEGGI